MIDFQWPKYKSGGFGIFRTFDKRFEYGKCTTSVSGTQSRRYSKSNLHFDFIIVVVASVVVIAAVVVKAEFFFTTSIKWDRSRDE